MDIQTFTIGGLVGKQSFLSNVNRMIDSFHQRNLPVIFVTYIGYGKLSPILHKKENDWIITKKRPDTFSSDEFTQLLQKLTPESLVITGLMSQACIQATCKSALKKNYSVTLIADGHDSIIKPFREIWNKKLQLLGARTPKIDDYLKQTN